MATTTVLVTGSNGLVGSSLRFFVATMPNHDFVFSSRDDTDLRDPVQVDALFKKHAPSIVVHLAAHVGGLFDNNLHRYTYYMENDTINRCIVTVCKKYRVRKLINILSTCIFPDNAQLPLRSSQIHDGPPHPSNSGYAYAKRNLEIMSRLLFESSGTRVINLIPTNLFGIEDCFDVERAHVIPALIQKCYEAKRDNTAFKVKGNGTDLRQFVFADDLSRIIIRAIEDNIIEFKNIIVCPPKHHEMSIAYLVNTIAKELNFFGAILWDSTTENTGQHCKTSDDTEIQEWIGCSNGVFSDFTMSLRRVITSRVAALEA